MENRRLYTCREVSNIELNIFVFTMVLLTKFNNYDLRIFISIFWFLRACYKSRGCLVIKRIYVDLLLLFIGIICYSFVVLFINQSTYFFTPLRYIRAMLNFLTITAYFEVQDIKSDALVKAVLNNLLLHACVVIVQIIKPEITPYVSIISGYSKRIFEYRASGLVSGYDLAGTYLNIGTFICLISLIVTQNKIYLLYSMIFTVAVFMTSRFSTVMLILVFFYLILIAKRLKRHNVMSFLIIVVNIVGIAVISFLAISMEFALPFREKIISEIPLVKDLYVNMTASYANYSVFDIIRQQVYVPLKINFIWGIAERAPTDPGYINTIYSIGLIGLFMTVGFYGYLLIRSKYELKIILNNKIYLDYRIVCLYTSILIIIFMLIMEIKLSFLFSTGIFEISIMFFIISKNIYDEFFK